MRSEKEWIEYRNKMTGRSFETATQEHGKKKIWMIAILAMAFVAWVCIRLAISSMMYDSKPYFYSVSINGIKEEFHYEGGTFHVAAKESDVADREIEFVFPAPCGEPSAWELIPEEQAFLISKETYEDKRSFLWNHQYWTRMRIGIHGNESGEFRLLYDSGQYGKDVMEVKYGAFLESNEGETSDPYNNYEELIVYVNGEPQTVNLKAEALKATAVASHTSGGEIELLLPDWDCMTDFWWLEEESDACYLLEAEKIPNEIKDYTEPFFPRMQRIRIGVKEGTKGEFCLSVKGLQGELHSVRVEYQCPEEIGKQVSEIIEEQVAYEPAEQIGEMVIYVEGKKYTISKEHAKLKVKAEGSGIEMILPLLANQNSQWRYRDHHERDIAFQASRTSIVRNSFEGEAEYKYVQKIQVGSHGIGNEFELVTCDKETGEEIVLKIDWEEGQ